MIENIIESNKKINIFINNHPEWGGTFQYTQLIIKAVEKKFGTVNFYYTNKIWEEELSNNQHFINYTNIQLFFTQILVFLGFINFPKFLTKLFLPSFPESFFKKDEIWLFPSQDIISTICKGKTIVSINDLMHRYSNFSETSSYFRKLYRDYKFKKISKKSYRILVDSKLGQKHVEDSYGRYKNIKVQYFSSLKEDFDEKSFKNLGKYLVYPAQYWEHKNHKKLLLAIEILNKKYKDIKLVLIGHKKKKYKEIKNLVNRLNLEDNVIFLGFVSDKEKAFLISNARALINPSFLGPTNIPQLEAFNYGCPVILANVFASKEQCFNNVIYFDPNHEDSIAKSVEKIWNFDELYYLYKNKSLEIAKKYSFENFSNLLLKNIF